MDIWFIVEGDKKEQEIGFELLDISYVSSIFIINFYKIIPFLKLWYFLYKVINYKTIVTIFWICFSLLIY